VVGMAVLLKFRRRWANQQPY